LLGSVGYDLIAHQFNQERVGVGYVDDCLMLAVNYITGYVYNGTLTPIANTTVGLQLSLRTLGPDVLTSTGLY
jgi:LPS-assembly protein